MHRTHNEQIPRKLWSWQPKKRGVPDLAEEIIENLEAGLNSFREVLNGLKKAS